MARATDGAAFANISATTAAFGLSGGQYAVIATATFGGGTVTLQVQGPDGSTFVTVTPAFAANAYAVVYLPPGQYKFAVATATAVYASITRIPGD